MRRGDLKSAADVARFSNSGQVAIGDSPSKQGFFGFDLWETESRHRCSFPSNQLSAAICVDEPQC